MFVNGYTFSKLTLRNTSPIQTASKQTHNKKKLRTNRFLTIIMKMKIQIPSPEN